MCLSMELNHRIDKKTTHEKKYSYLMHKKYIEIKNFNLWKAQNLIKKKGWESHNHMVSIFINSEVRQISLDLLDL